MIELQLTLKEARKLHKLLASVTDADMSPIQAFLNREIERAGLRAAKLAPWRKVVGRTFLANYESEKLECGHTRMLRSSASGRWQEDYAKRRRCEQCARANVGHEVAHAV